jgi:hypothetical protein
MKFSPRVDLDSTKLVSFKCSHVSILCDWLLAFPFDGCVLSADISPGMGCPSGERSLLCIGVAPLSLCCGFDARSLSRERALLCISAMFL